MKKIIRTATVTVFAILLVFLTANVSNAQPDWVRGRKYTKGQVDNIIKRVEERTDRFVGQLDKSLDNSRLNGTRREDNLNARARELEGATDELRGEFNRRQNWWETRENVQRCLNIASNINVAMRNRKFGSGAENNWKNVRKELNELAKVYDLPRV
jgi:hypothetical protein